MNVNNKSRRSFPEYFFVFDLGLLSDLFGEASSSAVAAYYDDSGVDCSSGAAEADSFVDVSYLFVDSDESDDSSLGFSLLFSSVSFLVCASSCSSSSTSSYSSSSSSSDF